MVTHKEFENGLNQHGYAFHQRILAEITKLAEKSTPPPWKVLAVELPVTAGDANTRIDFVLEANDEPSERHLLVGECKRVNPEYGSWCFAKASYLSPTWAEIQLIAESIVNLQEDSPVAAGAGGAKSDRLYQIGFTLSPKAGRAKDRYPVTQDKDAIENSCIQVLKGVNGLADLLVGEVRLRSYIRNRHFVQILPAIFTTAELFTTDVDLRRSNLESGQIELAEGDVVKTDWLFYQYPQSPRYKHKIDRGSLSKDKLEDVVGRDYVRSVAIVNPQGLKSFLETGWLDLAGYSGRVVARLPNVQL